MKAVSIVLIALLAAAFGLPARAAEHIHVIEVASNEKVVPHGSAADSLGDLLVFTNPIKSADGKVSIGLDRGYCVRTEVARWWECRWTMQLPGGTLETAGSYPDAGDSEFAIVGGTGRYAGARGTLKLHARDAAKSSYDFVIDLL
jgi:hypothetical protein